MHRATTSPHVFLVVKRKIIANLEMITPKRMDGRKTNPAF
jgi:hypothetical protein